MEVISKPWGVEILLFKTDKYACKKLVILPGHRLSLQYHKTKKETLFCLAGYGWIQQDYKLQFTEALSEGKTVHVEPGTVHRIGASAGNYLELLEVSTPELTDVVRLEDDYGRPTEPPK